MIKADAFSALIFAAPLLSYFAGRLNRYAGLAAAIAAAASGCALAVASGGSPAAAALLTAFCAALSAHAFRLNSFSASDGRAADNSGTIALLEKEIAGEKAAIALASGSEKRAALLYAVIKLLSETLDPESARSRFSRYLAEYFETGDFSFFLPDLDSDSGMELFASGGNNSGFSSWEALRAAMLQAGAGERSACVISSPARYVCVPVESGGECVGFFAFRPADDADAREWLESASRFAADVSFAVRRIQLFRRVEWLSLTDGLTGVGRRNALDAKMSEELRRAAAFKTTLGFMIVDIDHFKHINDAYGHQFGDAVLKRVGELLRGGVYETDFVGRYGGEEFGIVLPRADPAGVLRKAEALRQRIAAENFRRGFETVRITVSIGIAHFPRDGAEASGIFARADRALYAAKEGGRNRVIDAGSAGR